MADANREPQPSDSSDLTPEAAFEALKGIKLFEGDDAPGARDMGDGQTPPDEQSDDQTAHGDEVVEDAELLEIDDEAPEVEGEEPEANDDDPIVTVKVDGKPVEVRLSEALAGYQRHAAFTQKTQELAEERKAAAAAKAEAERAAKELRESRKQFGSKIDTLKQVLDSMAPKKPDFEKIREEEGDEAANTAFRRWNEQEARREAVAAQQRKVREDEQADILAEHKKLAAREQGILKEKMPALKDPAKAKDVERALLEAARANGFSDEEFYGNLDHRNMLLLDKARRFDALVAKKKKVVPPAGQVRRTAAPPGARRVVVPASQKARQEAIRRSASEGSKSAAEAALRHILPQDI